MSERTHGRCPKCGGELGSKQLEGVCPKCLMSWGLETVDGEPLPVDAGAGLGEPRDAMAEVPGRYTVIAEHARGGMGRILVVHDESLGRDVALKELLPGGGEDREATPTPARHSKELAARFLREAKVTGQLEHPGVAPVHELGRRPNGSLYYTMKLVTGRTLEAAIRAADGLEGRLGLLPHFVDLCQTLSYAHSRGVIHRDIKPSNVMIGEFGETVVVDWGLAKVMDAGGDAPAGVDPEAETVSPGEREARPADGETRFGEVMGTPTYMSPEQARGQTDQVDQRSDVYSLGAVLYQILTGRPPFSGKSVAEVIGKVIHEMPEPVLAVEGKVSRELALICERAMERDRERRTVSAGDLAREVELAARTPDVHLNPFRPYLSDLVPELRGANRLGRSLIISEASRRWRRRNLWPSIVQDLTVVGAISLSAAIAVVAFFALVALVRDLGFAGWEEEIWVGVTAGFLAFFALIWRAHNRSIAPYAREVLRERGVPSAPDASGWPVGARRLAVARSFLTAGLVGAGVGAYAGILLMEGFSPSPWSYMAPLLGLLAGVATEAFLRRGPAGAH